MSRGFTFARKAESFLMNRLYGPLSSEYIGTDKDVAEFRNRGHPENAWMMRLEDAILNEIYLETRHAVV